MSPSDIADANLIESVREHARWQVPCERVEEDGLLFVAGANAFPIGYRNCAVRVDRNVGAQDVLERAREFFGRRGRGFAVPVCTERDEDLESVLQATGLKPRADIPRMLIERPLPDAPMPPEVRVERFAEERHVRDAVEINAEAFQLNRLPPEEARLFFGRPSELLSGRVTGYVAYRQNQPVSTALTILSGAGAGVYWVGTVASAQRSGLGSLCTRLATNAGFARGASVVTLQASPFGEPVYRRLGYRTYGRLKWYVQRASG
jgi:ribosomal protein S18 acetylase RimI-like enzyme